MIDVNIISTKNDNVEIDNLKGNNDYLYNGQKYKTYSYIIKYNDSVIGLTSKEIYRSFFEHILENETKLYFLKDVFKKLKKENKLIIGITDSFLIKNIYDNLNTPNINDKRRFFYFIIKDKMILLYINNSNNDTSNLNFIPSYYESIEDIYYLYFVYLLNTNYNKFIKFSLTFLMKRFYLNFFKLFNNIDQHFGLIKQMIEGIIMFNLYFYSSLDIDDEEIKKILKGIGEKLLLHQYSSLAYLFSNNINIKDHEYNAQFLVKVLDNLRYVYREYFSINIRDQISRWIFDIPFILGKLVTTNLTNEKFKKLFNIMFDLLLDKLEREKLKKEKIEYTPICKMGLKHGMRMGKGMGLRRGI